MPPWAPEGCREQVASFHTSPLWTQWELGLCLLGTVCRPRTKQSKSSTGSARSSAPVGPWASFLYLTLQGDPRSSQCVVILTSGDGDGAENHS